MIITIRNKWLIRIAWRRWDVPSDVTAGHGLWLMWLGLRKPKKPPPPTTHFEDVRYHMNWLHESGHNIAYVTPDEGPTPLRMREAWPGSGFWGGQIYLGEYHEYVDACGGG